jgi:adenine-specific DNA methylase
MTDNKRLIEVDFPLEQVSLDSVHEKNVRHGHISTLHIWPARRPLAACRAALIATLLPDPGDAEERKEIYRRLAGEVVETIEQKKVGGRTVEKRKRETRGGILHWGRESSSDLEWFRKKIHEAHGGRAPKVLDPFAGGGAIPLEAMRLGCDVTAIEINPVAWFILKCTLEYPQKLAGQSWPLPDFALKDRDFMEAFLKAQGFKGASLIRHLSKLGLGADGAETELALIEQQLHFEADLAWQVRAWGRRVLDESRKRLAYRYPTYAEFQVLESGGRPFETRPLQLLKLDADGKTAVEPLNAGLDMMYLKDPRNPRWVAKPTVAYLWARTVRCKGCRATIPLLRTRWLVKKDKKRVLLSVKPNAEATGVIFAVDVNVPYVGGNGAQRREHDKRCGAGTMSRSGAQCLCCPTIMSLEDIRLEAHAGRLDSVLMSAIVDGPDGKEYRLPSDLDVAVSDVTEEELEALFSKIPFGLPLEPISANRPSPNTRGASGLPRYAIDTWQKVFSPRQREMLGVFLLSIRDLVAQLDKKKYSKDYVEAIVAYSCCCLSRLADRGSEITTWQTNAEKLGHTFARFVIPFTTDFAESNPLADSSGGFIQAVEWVAKVVEHCVTAAALSETTTSIIGSAASTEFTQADIILTDPPYYDAIPYSDLMDFFYVWLRRALYGLTDEYTSAFSEPLGPKWTAELNDGELVDQPGRFGNDSARSKKAYEDGMAAVFAKCSEALRPDGRLVLVFANKNPNAWETLVSALIRAGFLVDGSWPIQTERGARTNAITTASLASSVWLVCKKRPPARPGWDNAVLSDMRERIHTQLRTFWDAGIRGPDFVWAATGPALEAFSKYPVVKKADEPNAQMTVSEFLRAVRRLVVDFVVGRVLTHGEATEMAASLDDVTTYYLLHRHDFGLDDAPIGACILYALSCNLSDSELADRFDIFSRSGGTLFDDLEEGGESEVAEDTELPDDDSGSGGKGNKVRLKAWNQRKGKTLGYEAPGGRPVPLIDQMHRLMQLWRGGDEAKVDDYLDTRGLKRNALFAQLLQALIELAPAASDERSILESLSNHIASRGGISAPRQMGMEV